MTPAALLQKQLVIAGTPPHSLVMLGVTVGAPAGCVSSQPPTFGSKLSTFSTAPRTSLV